MDKEKVVFFLDYANINRAAREKRLHLDYHDLLQYVGEQRFLLDAHCYVPINPRNEHRRDAVIEELWRSGYLVTTKMGTIAGGTYKCNFDVEITMDILKSISQMKPDIIVLASGDADFAPLIQEIRKSGVRVEVAAFEETAGADILLKCSGFIDLAMYYEGYLASQDDEKDEVERTEQYKDLIQSQNGEQDGEHLVELDQGMIPLQECKLDENEGPSLLDQGTDERPVSATDDKEELGLYVRIDEQKGDDSYGDH
jgi:uncharacterized LabA/DUF88 family protein